MLFSVIYEANYLVPDSGIARGYGGQIYIDDVAPPNRRKLWKLTEANDEDTYSQRWRHRKWAAILTRREFNEFIRKTWLTAESVETMGSIGAPGFGFDWAPAVAFTYNNSEGQALGAYVTPVPEVNGKPRPDLLAKHQDRLFTAVRRVYGDDWERIVFAKEAA